MSYLPGSARPAIDFPISTGLSVASAFVCFQRGIACAREGSAQQLLEAGAAPGRAGAYR